MAKKKRDPHLLKEVRILEELKLVEVLMQLLLHWLTLTMVGNPCSHYALLAFFSYDISSWMKVIVMLMLLLYSRIESKKVALVPFFRIVFQV